MVTLADWAKAVVAKAPAARRAALEYMTGVFQAFVRFSDPSVLKKRRMLLLLLLLLQRAAVDAI